MLQMLLLTRHTMRAPFYYSYRKEKFGTSCGLDLHTQTDANYTYLLVTQTIFLAGAIVTAGYIIWAHFRGLTDKPAYSPLFSNSEMRTVGFKLLIYR